MSLGLPGQTLANLSPPPLYIQSTWLNDLINFVYEQEIKVMTRRYYYCKSQRKNNKNTIEGILQLKLKTQHIIQIEACRIYLQVAYLSDMVTPDGIKIIEEVLNCHQHFITTSNTKWPLQDRPSTSARQFWKNTLTKLYQLNRTKLPLIQRLKECITPISLCQTVHDWYYSITMRALYHHSEKSIENFFGIECDRLLLITVDSKETYSTLLNDDIPITLKKMDSRSTQSSRLRIPIVKLKTLEITSDH